MTSNFIEYLDLMQPKIIPAITRPAVQLLHQDSQYPCGHFQRTLAKSRRQAVQDERELYLLSDFRTEAVDLQRQRVLPLPQPRQPRPTVDSEKRLSPSSAQTTHHLISLVSTILLYCYKLPYAKYTPQEFDKK